MKLQVSPPYLAFLATLPSLSYAVTHIISVGYYESKFAPSSLTAAPGDSVEFQFHLTSIDEVDGNPHWPAITRGQFGGSPYKPVNGTGELSSWFLERQGDYNVNCIQEDTGLRRGNRANGRQTWTIQINSTEPIWYYDCDRYGIGMAGVINPPLDATEGSIEQWIEENKVLFVRDLGEGERCLSGQRGGFLGKREDDDLWMPESEEDTTTIRGPEDATSVRPTSTGTPKTTGSVTGTAITDTGSMTGTAIPEDTGSMTGTAITGYPTSGAAPELPASTSEDVTGSMTTMENTFSLTSATDTGSMTTMEVPSPSATSLGNSSSAEAPPVGPTFTGGASIVGVDGEKMAIIGLMGGLIAWLGMA